MIHVLTWIRVLLSVLSVTVCYSLFEGLLSLEVLCICLFSYILSFVHCLYIFKDCLACYSLFIVLLSLLFVCLGLICYLRFIFCIYLRTFSLCYSLFIALSVLVLYLILYFIFCIFIKVFLVVLKPFVALLSLLLLFTCMLWSFKNVKICINHIKRLSIRWVCWVYLRACRRAGGRSLWGGPTRSPPPPGERPGPARGERERENG